METKHETATVLRKAADIMEKGGYVKGLRGNRNSEDGAHCALGALDVCHNVHKMRIEAARKALADMVTSIIPKGKPVVDVYNGNQRLTENLHEGGKIAGWSNMIAGSAAGVACVMRAAAEWVEQEEVDGAPSK